MLMEISGNILCVANGRPAAPAARRSTGWPLFQQFQMVSGLKPLPLGGTLKWRGWREELHPLHPHRGGGGSHCHSQPPLRCQPSQALGSHPEVSATTTPLKQLSLPAHHPIVERAWASQITKLQRLLVPRLLGARAYIVCATW